MWIKFDLDGIQLRLKIEEYISDQDIDGEWASVFSHFKFGDIINYKIDSESMLLCCEIDNLKDRLKDLLDGRITEEEHFKCIEPDLEFLFYPKHDIRDEPNIIYVRPGCEIIDINMDLKVNLWAGGLTCNHFVTSFSREKINQFYLYLCLITKSIDKNNSEIQKMLKAGIIYFGI